MLVASVCKTFRDTVSDHTQAHVSNLFYHFHVVEAQHRQRRGFDY